MKITAIKQQQRLKDRYSIYVEGKYAFSVSESALIELKLASGQEVDAAQLDSYKQLSAEDKAYNMVLRYVAIRPRSVGELRDYFRRKKISEDSGQQLLNKLSNIGLVDDEAFARSWVENRRLLKPVSRRRLQQELTQKRVSDDIITAVLSEDAEVTDESEVLRQLVAKKRRQTKYQQDETKLMQYLARQGFSYDAIKAAIQDEPAED
jgi:regulatory protein